MKFDEDGSVIAKGIEDEREMSYDGNWWKIGY